MVLSCQRADMLARHAFQLAAAHAKHRPPEDQWAFLVISLHLPFCMYYEHKLRISSRASDRKAELAACCYQHFIAFSTQILQEEIDAPQWVDLTLEAALEGTEGYCDCTASLIFSFVHGELLICEQTQHELVAT